VASKSLADLLLDTPLFGCHTTGMLNVCLRMLAYADLLLDATLFGCHTTGMLTYADVC
jgi:hypothetical protein